MMTTPNIKHVKDYLLTLQEEIYAILLSEDCEIDLVNDEWSKDNGGGGKTLSISNGTIIEKAGINFSHIWGDALPNTATARKPEIANSPFQVVGLSLIIHPLNPYIPTCHANLRFFIAQTPDKKPIWWFGGGFDLTPYYAFEEDCIHWHTQAKKACEPFGADVYSRYKAWADDYFFLKHRNEPRGIGGLFFDDLNEWGFEQCFAFIRSIGEHFKEAYFPILRRRKALPFGEKERKFQCYRRGRYVEFNLVYDRGTLFGLQSQGRIESILISLPPLVSWDYNWTPESNSQEAALYAHYLKVRDWV